MVEQRYRAVLEVPAGPSKTAVAARHGVHRSLGWYAESGPVGSADRRGRALRRSNVNGLVGWKAAVAAIGVPG